MSSPCLEPRWRRARRAALALALAGLVPQPNAAGQPQAAPLRVCADPDNLPYSHRDGSGFENRIAALVAGHLGRPLHYVWQPQRRGLVRKTLASGRCELLIGVPAGLERLATTRPYYRSGYVWLNPAEEPALAGFEDPRLARLRIGVQLVGDDLAATPPGHALARRGITRRVVGFTVEGEGPAAARMVAALSDGRLDAALVWGPQAGWFARRSARPLRLQAAQAPADLPLPFEFDIAFGVRSGDAALRAALDALIETRGAEIGAILAAYAVPHSARAPRRLEAAP